MYRCPNTRTPTPAAPPGSVEISLYSSDTKDKWLDALVETFNADPPKTSAGHPVFARVYHVKSGSVHAGHSRRQDPAVRLEPGRA